MSQGEFRELIRSLDPKSTDSGTLAAFWAGEDVGPEEVAAVLDVARLSAVDLPAANRVIDVALTRLKEAYPDEVG